MKITCSAIAGYIAAMALNNGLLEANENGALPQTITITAECSSVDSVWNYVTVLQGETYRIPMTGLTTCSQIPNQNPTIRTCSSTAVTYGMGDNQQPEVQIDVTQTE